MMEKQPSETLALQTTDYVASAAKAALGAVPFAGSLLSELAGTLIPNQRIERLVKFAEVLEQRLSGMEQGLIRAQLNNENFTDLLEEGLRQAARSLSDERREYISNLIANSLSHEDVEYVESKHLLRILGEINDIEVIWLKNYFEDVYGDIEGFWEKHKAILEPVGATLGAPQNVADKETLQISYQEHLADLGLLQRKYRIDRKTGMPEFNNVTKNFQVSGYALAPLGLLLVRHIGAGKIEP